MVKEFGRLFASLFEDPKPYADLIRILAKHRYGVGQSELITQSKLPDGGSTVRRLHQLEEAGFITSLVPYGQKTKGYTMFIDNEYSLFYLRWIEPNLKTISKKATNDAFGLHNPTNRFGKFGPGMHLNLFAISTSIRFATL